MVSNQLAGRQVQTHRVRLGLSPEQYGMRTGLSGGTIRRIEAGCPSVRSTQVKIAKELGVEVDELFPLSLDRWAA